VGWEWERVRRKIDLPCILIVYSRDPKGGFGGHHQERTMAFGSRRVPAGTIDKGKSAAFLDHVSYAPSAFVTQAGRTTT
jgi:hypothetical protein